MPAQYRVILSARASADLHEIHRHIAGGSPRNAAGVAAKLLDAIDALALLPHRYPVYQGRRSPSGAVRRMPVPPFLVYYHADDSRLAVEIITIRHGKRRQPRSFR